MIKWRPLGTSYGGLYTQLLIPVDHVLQVVVTKQAQLSYKSSWQTKVLILELSIFAFLSWNFLQLSNATNRKLKHP